MLLLSEFKNPSEFAKNWWIRPIRTGFHQIHQEIGKFRFGRIEFRWATKILNSTKALKLIRASIIR
jgi:hypothetical protein